MLKLYEFSPNNIGPARLYVMSESLEGAWRSVKEATNNEDNKWTDFTGLYEPVSPYGTEYNYEVREHDVNDVVVDRLC